MYKEVWEPRNRWTGLGKLISEMYNFLLVFPYPSQFSITCFIKITKKIKLYVSNIKISHGSEFTCTATSLRKTHKEVYIPQNIVQSTFHEILKFLNCKWQLIFFQCFKKFKSSNSDIDPSNFVICSLKSPKECIWKNAKIQKNYNLWTYPNFSFH